MYFEEDSFILTKKEKFIIGNKQMKMIKPIVNIAKIADDYDTFILGFDGVLSEGNGILPDAATCLNNLFERHKQVILLSNTSQRVIQLAETLQQGGVSPSRFACVMTSGEVLHYMLKSHSEAYAALGNVYYHIGDNSSKGVFYGLDYSVTADIEKAHFIYMSEVSDIGDTIDTYRPLLEQAANLGMPFVCAGNDTSCFKNGKICLAPGALAEQYAIMGGRIITLGKPDVRMFRYCTDSLPDIGRVIVIGDNVATDIKAATALEYDSVLISKGIHVNYLGEGYIPDVAKTRELSNNYDSSPNFVISNLRW